MPGTVPDAGATETSKTFPREEVDIRQINRGEIRARTK